MSQQMNSILMALAGAERIFALIDAKPEEDEGYVTLVNAEEAEDGTLTEIRRVHRQMGVETLPQSRPTPPLTSSGREKWSSRT